MSAERAASQALCGRAEDSQVPHLLTLGKIFFVERAVRSCKGLVRGCLGAVGYALCTMHFALCTMHCPGAAGASGGRLLDKCTTRYHDFPLILKYTLNHYEPANFHFYSQKMSKYWTLYLYIE